MPLPFATIGLSLAAAGLKMFGHESKLVEFAAHPLDLTVGHLWAEKILELRKWLAGQGRIENEDLERAVTRAAILADLFCLLDALPPQPIESALSRLREQLKRWLPGDSLLGVLSQAIDSTIRPAIKACEKRLKEVEGLTLRTNKIDPQTLILPERSEDWGAKLAAEALKDLQREHTNLPAELETVFRTRWFPYLCLSFQEQIKTNPRVSTIFLVMQIATGFVRLEDAIRELEQVVRDEAESSRRENREQHEEAQRGLTEILVVLKNLANTGVPAPESDTPLVVTISVDPQGVLQIDRTMVSYLTTLLDVDRNLDITVDIHRDAVIKWRPIPATAYSHCNGTREMWRVIDRIRAQGAATQEEQAFFVAFAEVQNDLTELETDLCYGLSMFLKNAAITTWFLDDEDVVLAMRGYARQYFATEHDSQHRIELRFDEDPNIWRAHVYLDKEDALAFRTRVGECTSGRYLDFSHLDLVARVIPAIAYIAYRSRRNTIGNPHALELFQTTMNLVTWRKLNPEIWRDLERRVREPVPDSLFNLERWTWLIRDPWEKERFLALTSR